MALRFSLPKGLILKQIKSRQLYLYIFKILNRVVTHFALNVFLLQFILKNHIKMAF